ncbi:hypothetical protein FIV00_03240 [Labrenzia sp. THAF82]|nr:hypothetical protein FIV00_03025 [Labrenzia sp. THAF82]QFT29486.1 hypothetical protein FIV00_03240 [Labrenzia sp. THAF82]
MIPSQPCVEATDIAPPKCAAWVARLQDDLVAYPYFASLLGKQPAVRQRVFFEETLR